MRKIFLSLALLTMLAIGVRADDSPKGGTTTTTSSSSGGSSSNSSKSGNSSSSSSKNDSKCTPSTANPSCGKKDGGPYF